jgi:ArsR family transcriptional regulator, cadmium/lead-responsive transcriptional repressor
MAMKVRTTEAQWVELAPAAALFRSLADPTRLAIVQRWRRVQPG